MPPHPLTGARSILITDDEKALRTLNKLIIGGAFPEADIQTAMSADEALRLLLETRFDLIVTDLQMPGDYDGNDLARAAHDRGIPCVMVTGEPSQANTEFLSGLLGKPYSREHLITALNVALGLRLTEAAGIENSRQSAKA